MYQLQKDVWSSHRLILEAVRISIGLSCYNSAEIRCINCHKLMFVQVQEKVQKLEGEMQDIRSQAPKSD